MYISLLVSIKSKCMFKRASSYFIHCILMTWNIFQKLCLLQVFIFNLKFNGVLTFAFTIKVLLAL